MARTVKGNPKKNRAVVKGAKKRSLNSIERDVMSTKKTRGEKTYLEDPDASMPESIRITPEEEKGAKSSSHLAYGTADFVDSEGKTGTTEGIQGRAGRIRTTEKRTEYKKRTPGFEAGKKDVGPDIEIAGVAKGESIGERTQAAIDEARKDKTKSEKTERPTRIESAKRAIAKEKEKEKTLADSLVPDDTGASEDYVPRPQEAGTEPKADEAKGDGSSRPQTGKDSIGEDIVAAQEALRQDRRGSVAADSEGTGMLAAIRKKLAENESYRQSRPAPGSPEAYQAFYTRLKEQKK